MGQSPAAAPRNRLQHKAVAAAGALGPAPPLAPVAAAAGGSGAAAGSPGAGGRAGSPAAGAWCGSISSLCSRSNCSDGDLGQLPSLSRHGNESRRLKDKWLIKKQCCIAGFFIPPTAASAEAVPLARSLSPALGEGAVRQPVPVPKLIMCLINYSHQTTCPRSPLVRSGADGKSDARCPSPGDAGVLLSPAGVTPAELSPAGSCSWPCTGLKQLLRLMASVKGNNSGSAACGCAGAARRQRELAQGARPWCSRLCCPVPSQQAR